MLVYSGLILLSHLGNVKSRDPVEYSCPEKGKAKTLEKEKLNS
jgi:hypothetical protein